MTALPNVVRSDFSQLSGLLSENRGLTLVEFGSGHQSSHATAASVTDVQTSTEELSRYGFDTKPSFALYRDEKLVVAIPKDSPSPNHLDEFWNTLTEAGNGGEEVQSYIDKTLGKDQPPTRSQEWHDRFPDVDFQLYEHGYPNAVPNSYIVHLKDGCSCKGHVGQVKESKGVKVKHGYTIINGYTAELSDEGLALVAGKPEVERITQNTILRLPVRKPGSADKPWGLERIKREGPSSNELDPAKANVTSETKVDVYVIDSGIYVEHNEFQGRARWGENIGNVVQQDLAGHGTAVAGIIGGATYGVDPTCNIIALKVISHWDQDENDYVGYDDEIVQAFESVRDRPVNPNNRRIINYSVGGTRNYEWQGLKRVENTKIGDAVAAVIAAGVPVCAAAGNEKRDASRSTPGYLSQVITVGASDINNDFCISFSNHGSAVKINAPGKDILSAAATVSPNPPNLPVIPPNPAATSPDNTGTSFASPHVTGVGARILRRWPDISPATLMTALRDMATPDVKGAPPNTTNLLLRDL